MSDVLPPFSWPLRIYYEDTDAGGVVYYANYLRYLERARTEWFRSLGFNQRELAAQIGCLFVVSSVHIDYKCPARLDQAIQVTVEIVKLGRSCVRFHQRCLLTPTNTLLAKADVCVVCVDALTFKPRSIPARLREGLETRPRRFEGVS